MIDGVFRTLAVEYKAAHVSSVGLKERSEHHDPALRSGTTSGVWEQAGSFGRGQPCLLMPMPSTLDHSVVCAAQSMAMEPQRDPLFGIVHRRHESRALFTADTAAISRDFFSPLRIRMRVCEPAWRFLLVRSRVNHSATVYMLCSRWHCRVAFESAGIDDDSFRLKQQSPLRDISTLDSINHTPDNEVEIDRQATS